MSSDGPTSFRVNRDVVIGDLLLTGGDEFMADITGYIKALIDNGLIDASDKAFIIRRQNSVECGVVALMAKKGNCDGV